MVVSKVNLNKKCAFIIYILYYQRIKIILNEFISDKLFSNLVKLFK